MKSSQLKKHSTVTMWERDPVDSRKPEVPARIAQHKENSMTGNNFDAGL